MKKISRRSKLKYGMFTLNCTSKNIYSSVGFHYYKTIYFHIPKTAGVSISKSLFKNLGLGHIDVLSVKDNFLQSDFEDYFKFTFVRNPYTRLISAYYFLKNGGFDERDKVWVNNNLKEYNSFEEFVLGWLTPENCMLKNHFRPQYSFILDPDTKENKMNYIGRFENLESDYSVVAKKLQIRRKLLFENKTSTAKIDYHRLKNDVKKRIVSCYEHDFTLLGYPKEL